MADNELNQGQEQTPEEIKNPPEEINEDELEQVSGGMQQPGSNYASDIFGKQPGNLVNGDGVKKNPIGDIPSSKTVKL